MPLQRLNGNGMSYSDATQLHARSISGEDWAEVARELALANTERAERAVAHGHTVSARSWYLFASACWRFGQIPLRAGPVKSLYYQALIATFAEAIRLETPAGEHIRLARGNDVVCGWLERPPGVERPATVIIFGGFDGWREEYDRGAQTLRARGLSTFLVDGPGQGESRLFEKSYFRAGSERAITAAVDYVLTRQDLADYVAVWGNSFGGYLAATLASTDGRIAACCVNGGTTRPVEILDRYPRFIATMRAMTGDSGDAAAQQIFAALEHQPHDLESLRCPLLVLHGLPDQVFLHSNAAKIIDWCGSSDKTMLTWEDGDHCIYNYTDEKHNSVADWFSDRLLGTG